VEGAGNLVGKKVQVEVISCHRTHARARMVHEDEDAAMENAE
jgi:uncharacterized protein YacL